MFAIASLLLLGYWLLFPTLASAFLPKAKRLGREGTAALIGVVSWIVLSHWWPLPLYDRGNFSPVLLSLLCLSALAYLGLFALGLERRPAGFRKMGFRDDFWSLGVLSPLDEELLFRGLLFRVALSAHWGTVFAVIFPAVLFALAHELPRLGGLKRSLRESISDLAFGLLTGTSLAVLGTILVPIALHVGVNSVYAYGRERAEP